VGVIDIAYELFKASTCVIIVWRGRTNDGQHWPWPACLNMSRQLAFYSSQSKVILRLWNVLYVDLLYSSNSLIAYLIFYMYNRLKLLSNLESSFVMWMCVIILGSCFYIDITDFPLFVKNHVTGYIMGKICGFW